MTYRALDSFCVQGLCDFYRPKLLGVNTVSAFLHSLITDQAKFLQICSMKSCKNLIFYSRFSQSAMSCHGKNSRLVLTGHEHRDKDKLQDLRKLHDLGIAQLPQQPCFCSWGGSDGEIQCQLKATYLFLVLHQNKLLLMTEASCLEQPGALAAKLLV